ncbi:MFS transporter [Arachnia propionica]|nr:MFS transporter [Arachnia propionica]
MSDTDGDEAMALGHRRVTRGRVLSWCLWDWGTQPFATVITTFVFGAYISSGSLFGTGEHDDTPAAMLGVATAVAGVLIALLAPVLGQGSDRSGKRMRHLMWQTLALAVLSAALWFVAPEPSHLWLGLVLLGLGNVVAEVANVNYYASIERVATPETVGRVSGLGWGMGYLGGIVILLIIVGASGGDVDATDVRNAMLLCGAWTVVFTIPIFLAIKDHPVASPPPRQGVAAAYRELFASIRRIYRASPHTIWFLLSSALFRDGLAGVFTFGAVLAVKVFGFSPTEVIIFGVVANVTAGITTIAFGHLDDRIGPKRVILISLVSLVVLGVAMFVLHGGGQWVFWVFGLLMTVFVGPAQSASRSFLARIIPEGHSGEVFGLYATTGRAVSFLSSTMWVLLLWVGSLLVPVGESAVHFGVLGVVLVLAAGLVALLPVREDGHRTI